MPTFEYKALTTAGERVAGVLAGATESAVLAELESRRLTPITLREAKDGGFKLSLGQGVSSRRLAETYLQLADMLRAGVPLLRALRLLSKTKSSKRVGETFRVVADAVSEGEDLADAMAAHPRVFKRTHVAVVRAGERGGFLEDAFARLGSYVTNQAELRSKLIGSMMYPGVIVSIFVVILVVLFTVFIPKFKPMFERLDDIPALSAAILAAGDAFREHGLVTFSVLAVVCIGVWWWARSERGKRAVSKAMTRAPVVGRLVRAVATGRFSRRPRRCCAP